MRSLVEIVPVVLQTNRPIVVNISMFGLTETDPIAWQHMYSLQKEQINNAPTDIHKRYFPLWGQSAELAVYPQ